MVNQTYYLCQPCNSSEAHDPFWDIDNWGHWKRPDDIMCRCCHEDGDFIDTKTFELDGAL